MKKMKPKIERINDIIDQAFEYQEKDAWKDNVKRYKDYFKGKYYDEPSDTPRYTVNTIFNFVNLLVPNMFFKEPFIRVKPKTKNIIRKNKDGTLTITPSWRVADLLEAVLNKELINIGFEDEIRKCVQDALIYGFGILKVGYSMETESLPDNESGETKDDFPRVREEGIFAGRICPLDFGFDPFATCTEDARFLVHRTVRPVEEIKANDNYKNTSDLKGEIPEDFRKRSKADPEGDFVTLYEIHDQLKNKIITAVKGHDKILREIDNPYDFKGSHFIILKLAGDNDEFVGTSFVGVVESEALAVNETVTKMVRHLDIFPGQVVAEQGAIDDDEKQKMVMGEQGSILDVQNGAIREGRIHFKAPVPMGSDYFNVISTLQGIMDLVLGIPDFVRSGSTKRKTASEVTMEQQDATIRKEYFLNFVKKFILNATKKECSLIQQYYTREQEVRIEGETGINYLKWTSTDIKGDFDLDYDLTTQKFMNQARVQQIINLFNILGAHAKTVPAFQKLLQSIDGDRAGKVIFDAMDVNFEELKKKAEIPHLEFDPYKENAIAQAGKVVPDPKPMEPHREHLDIHLPEYELTQNVELKRHIEMHIFLDRLNKGEIDMNKLRTQSAPQAGAVSQPAAPQPNAAPARTEPEIQGGFFGNQ